MSRPGDKQKIRWSGLETTGMLTAFSSMLFPVDYQVDLMISDLPAGRVTVRRDKGYGESDALIDFPGCGVCRFQLSSTNPECASLPHDVTVAGKCLYTKHDRKEFSIMMRKRKDGKKQGIGANGELDWPDVASLELCPYCGCKQKVGKTYWLIYYPLLQIDSGGAAMLIGTRMHSQLVCIKCFQDVLKGQMCSMGSGMDGRKAVNILDILEQMPAMPLFHEDGLNRNATKLMGAYSLFTKWEDTGTMKALQLLVQSAMGKHLDARLVGEGIESNDSDLADANATSCLVCRKEGAEKTCSRCSKAVYCSRECQRADWKRHKLTDCIPIEKKVAPLETEKVAFSVSPVCPCCGDKDIDKGLMVFCFLCGSIQMCHVCAVKREYTQLTGPVVCEPCIRQTEGRVDERTVPHLKALLKKKPSGPHVNFVHLMLAQCYLSDDEEATGIKQNVKAAKREYLRLANEEEFGPALYAMASMCNPEDKEAWAGPLNYLTPLHPNDNPFPKDAERARRLYLKAANKNCIPAMNDLGLMYKNGCTLFPQNKEKALDLFRKAARAGDPRSMCNAGKLLVYDEQVNNATEGLFWYRKAAKDYHWRTAQVMLVQIGVINNLIEPAEARQHAKELKESGFLESERCQNIYSPENLAMILDMCNHLGV